MKIRIFLSFIILSICGLCGCDNLLHDVYNDITQQKSWYTFLGGSGSDIAYSVDSTSDGGCIVAGFSNADISSLNGKSPINNYTSDRDMLIVKLDSAGSVAWYTFLGTSSLDQAQSVQQTSDGGYIVAGYACADISTLNGKSPINSYSGSSADMFIVKLDSAGNVAWYTFLGGSGTDYAYSVDSTSDGGYIVAGCTSADISSLGGQTPVNSYSSGYDMITVKLDSAGNVAWYTFLGGSGTDNARAVTQASDGGYIVAGYTNADISSLGGQSPVNSYTSGNDMITVKLNSAGSVTWYTFLGGSGTDVSYSVDSTSDGGCIVAGYTMADISSLNGKSPINNYTSGNDIITVKLDSAGNVAWYTFLGGSGTDNAYSVDSTSDGGCIVAGYSTADISSLGGQTPVNSYSTGSDMITVKLDSAGNVSWYTFLGDSGNDYAWSVNQAADGGYLIAGYSTADISGLGGQTPVNSYSTGSDMLVVKLKGDGTIVPQE